MATETNPAKIIGNVKKRKQKVDFWTKEEFEKVISLIYVENYYQNFLFIFMVSVYDRHANWLSHGGSMGRY